MTPKCLQSRCSGTLVNVPVTLGLAGAFKSSTLQCNNGGTGYAAMDLPLPPVEGLGGALDEQSCLNITS